MEMVDGEKLYKIRSALKMSQKEIATILEIKQGSYSDIERGKKDRHGKPIGISAEIRQNLIEKLNVSQEYIRTGEGDMFKNQEVKDVTNNPNKMSTNDENYWRELTRSQQETINNLVKLLYSESSNKARTG